MVAITKSSTLTDAAVQVLRQHGSLDRTLSRRRRSA